MNVAIAAGLGISGFLLGYFPKYASLSGPLDTLFILLSWILYATAIVGALFGISSLLRTKVLEYMAIAAVSSFIAFGAHSAANGISIRWAEVSVRILALSLVCFSAIAVCMGIAHLFSPSSPESSPDQYTDLTPQPIHAPKTRPEQVIGLVVAVLALITAVLQFFNR